MNTSEENTTDEHIDPQSNAAVVESDVVGKRANEGNSVRAKMKSKAFILPNLITVIGIFCGFLAIISAIKGHFEYSAVCIAWAIVIDGLDGRVARRLNATSHFGMEFDSLSDQVAFGVAPAVLVYQWAFATTADDIGVLVAFIYVVCTATRLARFNVTSIANPLSKHFQGLPSPGAAVALISLVYLAPAARTSQYQILAILIYTAFIGFLMVSSLPFMSIKHLKLHAPNVKLLLVVLAFAVAFTWYNSRLVIFVGSTLYALSGIIIPVSRYMRKQPALDKTTVTPPETPK